MKVAAAVDEYGHFDVVPLTNRKGIIKLLESLQGGDYWANVIEDDYPDAEKFLNNCGQEEFEKAVEGWSARGLMEIVTIRHQTNGRRPKNC